jgi:HlyD family secretion protein
MAGTVTGKLVKWSQYSLFAVILALIIYWVRFSPVPVTGQKIASGEIIAEVMGTGTLEARIQTVISSKISGRIDRMLVDQGDRVERAQPLILLDDGELRQQVEMARSAHSASTAAVERVQADNIRARIVLEQVRRDQDRNQKLFAEKVISISNIEKSEMAQSVAAADLSRSEAADSEARKNLIVAQNTLDYHLARLEDTVIKAPFDGLIVRRDREPGDVVVPGSSIFLLISTQELWVRAWVDETEMEKLVPGQEARVIFRSEPGRPFPGEVARLSRETDRETKEFLVDVRVKSLPQNWAIGQRAEVFIKTAGKKDVVLLPARFILKENDSAGVFVEAQGKAVWRPLKIGLSGKENVEILEGLHPGDTVITPVDPKRFFKGRKVRITG